MSKIKMILTLGVWIAILPYLGFPYAFKDILYSLTGFSLIFFSYLLYKEFKVGDKENEIFDNFSENSDFKENKEEFNN